MLDRPIHDHTHRDYDRDDIRYNSYRRDSDDTGWGWLLPLLLIPLLLVGGWMYLRNQNKTSAYNSPVNTTNRVSPTSSVQYGVGGAPNTSATVTASPSPTPKYQDSMDKDTNSSMNTSNKTQVGVGGGSQNVQTPSGAPNTGRGE
jgi:hypothetical protein